MTNIIGSTLQDPWEIEGIPRLMVKKAATPLIYGSSKSCFTLWQDAGLEYTKTHIELFTSELAGGPLGLANQFKEFIINNCNPKAVMNLDIWNDKFEVECNRFRRVGDKARAFKIWDSTDEQYNNIIHNDVVKVPDLERFRRFFVTGLIHNIDSQVADNIMSKIMKKHDWGIPIHDAVLISPAAADDTRKWYGQELEEIHKNRKDILQRFFRSIGITRAATAQWNALKTKITPLEGELHVNPMALK